MHAPEVYRQRRERLMADLPGGQVLLMGGVLQPYTFAANPLPFRQDSSFLYFTGLTDPDLALLLDVDRQEAWLVADEAGPEDALWMQPPALDALMARAGLTQRLSHAELPARLGPVVRHLPPTDASMQRRLLQALQERPLAACEALIQAVVKQRECKTGAERAEMARALALTLQMHELAGSMAQPGVSEQAIVNAMQSLVASHGARMAYQPVCTVRGEVLHHLRYDNVLAPGDWLLVDAGIELPSGYCADVTRTWSVGGAMSGERAVIHQAVAHAQAVAIAAMRPGVAFARVHEQAALALVEGLHALKLFKAPAADVVAQAAYGILFPHGLGHLIGLDVHDMEPLGEDRVGYDAEHRRSTRFGPNHLRLGKCLREGMTVTVEPGVYIVPALLAQWRAEQRHTDLIDHERLARLQGLGGVRIEDVVLVQAEGTQRLQAVGPEALV